MSHFPKFSLPRLLPPPPQLPLLKPPPLHGGGGGGGAPNQCWWDTVLAAPPSTTTRGALNVRVLLAAYVSTLYCAFSSLLPRTTFSLLN